MMEGENGLTFTEKVRGTRRAKAKSIATTRFRRAIKM